MTDFLLELRSEEIPARMQGKAKEDLARLFTDALAKAGLSADSVETFATPRRLALIAKGLPLETAAVSEETKGPKTSAPPQAVEGFLRKVGLSQDELVERDAIYFAVVNKPGRKTADVLAEAIPAIVRAFPWPKSMRWGKASISTESLRWVRPLQGIVAILGNDLVELEVDGIASGYETLGHRFHHAGPITIGNAADYEVKLRAAHVILHFSERCAIIRETAKKMAADKGLVWIEDEALVAENAGLTEWPVPLIGDFDPAFLEVPREVIQLTLATNQKYFVCADGAGKLAPAFICTANIEANDGGAAIVAGNRKVLAARLSDARFFWEQDQKKTLAEHADGLARITFHEKLGTVADKVDRVAKLARWLVEEGIVTDRSPAKAGGQGDGAQHNTGLPPAREHGKEALAEMAEQAARLSKADLVTEMVGEFPELQGVMGGYYAAKEGLPIEVSNAIRDHYKPVGQGDDVPTDPVTVAVSLADKLDTIDHFFDKGLKPTGSKDPFALRRAALGVIAICKASDIRLSLIMAAVRNLMFDKGLQLEPDMAAATLADVLDRMGPHAAAGALKGWLDHAEIPSLAERYHQEAMLKLPEVIQTAAEVRDFFIDRLEVSERENGMRQDIVTAAQVIDAGGGREDDLVRLLARVKALQAFVGTEDGANLLAGYKRAANLLKQAEAKTDSAEPVESSPSASAQTAGHPSTSSGLTVEEQALVTALDTAEPKAKAAVDAEDFEGAMAALATLRAPVDSFFDAVMVNDPDPDLRAFRLGLLARVRDAVHQVADFSKIEG